MPGATAIEKIVLLALIHRGYTPPEAQVVISKLRETANFNGTAAIELSSDGKFVAIADCLCAHRTPVKDKESQGALLIKCAGREFWIPFTQLAPMSEVSVVGDKGILVVKRWIAERIGLIVHGAVVSKIP